jgi:hypothetical protein
VTLSRHPGSSSGPFPLTGPFYGFEGRNVPDVPFARRTRPQVPPTAVHLELGPRSLDPAAVFAARYAELIRDQTPPDDFCNCISTCGQPNQRLSFSSQGRWPRPPSFSYVSRRSSLSSDTRRAALRPLPTTPVLVPPGYPSLPSRDVFESAPPPPVNPSVHSEDQRARVEGPSEGRVPIRMQRCPVPASGSYAYVA